MNRVIDPEWVPLNCAALDAWDSSLSAEGFRAAVMFCLTQMRRGLCPPTSGHLAYYAGPATGGMRGAVIELDRIVPFNSLGERGFEWVEERRKTFMGLSEKNREVARKRELRKRNWAEQPPPPPVDAYDLPAYAGVPEGSKRVFTSGGTSGDTLGSPQVAQKENRESARAPAPPSAPFDPPTPVGAKPLGPSSGASSAAGPPSSGPAFGEGETWSGSWVCVGCGDERGGAGVVGVSKAPMCRDCDLARVPAPLAAAWVDGDVTAWLNANEPYRRGKPLPVTPAGRFVAELIPRSEKVSADSAVSGDAGSAAGGNGAADARGSEVPVSGLPRPGDHRAGQSPVARPDVRKVPSADAQPVLVARGPKSKGAVAAKVGAGKAAAKLKPGPKPKPKAAVTSIARKRR